MERKRRPRQLWLIFIIFFTMTLPVAAQVVELPSTADPARVPPRTPEEFGKILKGPSLEITAPAEVGAYLAHPVLLQKVVLRGTTVYSDAELSPAWTSYLGRNVDNEDLRAIASVITQQYQTSDYLLARAHFAGFDTDSGVAIFEVIEGFISGVQFKGLRSQKNLKRLQAYAREIQNSRPLQARVLYRYLYLMDDIPGIHTSADLEVNPAEAGAALEIEVSYQPFVASAGLNNRGTRHIGPQRASAAAGMNGLFGLDEGISLGLATTPRNTEELQYGEVRWQQIVDGRGTQLMLGGAWYRSQPDVSLHLHPDLPPANLLGSGAIYSVGLRFPVIRSGKENLSVTVGYNHEQATAKVELSEFDLRLGVYQDRLRSVIWILSGRRVDERNDLSASVSLTRGLNIFGAEDSPFLSRSRTDGLSEFTKFNSNLSGRRNFGSKQRWSLYLAGTGQYSLDPLLAGEEFGLGGLDSVRVLDPATFSGDSGAAATVELRYDQPRLIQRANLQLYGFYDAGKVSNRGDHPFQAASASAAAMGSGLRFHVPRTVSGTIVSLLPSVEGYLEAAWPIWHKSDTPRSYDPRFFFGLVLRN